MENLCGRNKTLYFGLNVAVCVSLPKRGTEQGSTAGGSQGKFNTSLFWAVFFYLAFGSVPDEWRRWGSLLSRGCLLLPFCHCLCTFPLQRFSGKCGMSIVWEACATFLWPWCPAWKHKNTHTLQGCNSLLLQQGLCFKDLHLSLWEEKTDIHNNPVCQVFY